MGILLRLAASAAAVWVATLILPGIQVNTDSTGEKIATYFAVAILFGVVNAVIRPVIKMVGCSIYVVTLGLISFVVNGLLLLLTSWFASLLELPFHVDGFWSGVLGAIVIGLVGWLLNLFIKNGSK